MDKKKVNVQQHVQQKLRKRNTYTPTDTSLVCRSVICPLNKEETLSEAGSKTFLNNPEENQLQQERRNTSVSVYVYVLNMRGHPLMPTTPKKARILLKKGKAKVLSRKPFTIQLKYATGETKQPIKLGIDAGYSVIGFSATTNKKELISGEVKLRKNVSNNLTQRRMYRRTRRNKLWYRKPRFDNRSKSNNNKEKWFAPSINHKLQSHLLEIAQLLQ